METRQWNWCWLTMVVSLAVVDSSIWLSGSISQGDDNISPNAIDAVSIETLTLQDLQQIPIEKGAQIIDRIYHINRAKHDILPNFVPSASSIPVHFIRTNGQRMSTTLNNINTIISRIPHFAITELDIFITGLPEISDSISQSYSILIDSYLKRYNFHNRHQTMPMAALQGDSNLMIIELGATLTSIPRIAMLDTRRTGIMMAQMIIGWLKERQSLEKITIPIHIMAHGIGAHVAGAIGNEYSRLLDQNIKRISALDPSKIFYRDISAIVGLKVGDADFIDVIHTSAYGLGSTTIMGDCDFFPNGPGIGVPGTENMIAASMRAIHYFAESMIPGNEHNFPAIKCNSLAELKQINQEYRHPRTYMGIKTDLDIKGTFILDVNAKSPYGQRTTVDRKPFIKYIKALSNS